MKRLLGVTVGAFALLALMPNARAQDVLVPAGTLIQCTMDEPNLSSATAAVGDPVLCHLKTMQEFGRPLFPRGSMLAGHIEAEKEPGHFVGKGYLKITFDRVILPGGDLPVPAKVIGARGYKVDKQGDIDGKGHATRDVVEWLFPPLWPWKVISLPFRGPRPTLKGEEPLQLRLMDDIVIPRNLAQIHPDRPQYASQSYRPSSYTAAPRAATQPVVQLIAQKSNADLTTIAGSTRAIADAAPANPAAVGPLPQASERFTMLVLKSNLAYEVARYHREGDVLLFTDMQGEKGSVDVQDVDWRRTAQMTAEVRSVDAPIGSRQLN